LADKRPEVVRDPSNKELPVTAKVAPGVVVATPSRLVTVLAVNNVSLPGAWISKALPDEVEILKGSEIIKEAYCPPMASMVVVPDELVWKAR